MNRQTLLKYAQFVLIVAVFVFADQWTKLYASDWLASQRPGHFSHNIVLEVPPEAEGAPVHRFLSDTFTSNTPDEIDAIAQNHVRTPQGNRLAADAELRAGDTIEVTRREVTVIDGYWDFQYTRNPGAAFSILADVDPSIRRPFFLTIGVVAVLAMVLMLRSVPLRQQFGVWGLALLAAGALGNLIDRYRYDYVIDFIVWKYGEVYRWPTFNVADALIWAGAICLGIEMIRDALRARRAERAQGDDAQTTA